MSLWSSNNDNEGSGWGIKTKTYRDSESYLAETLEPRVMFSGSPVEVPNEVPQETTQEQVIETTWEQVQNALLGESVMSMEEEINHVKENLSSINFFPPTDDLGAWMFQIQALATLSDGSVYDIGGYLDQVVEIDDQQIGIGDIRYTGENSWMNYGSDDSVWAIQFGYTTSDGKQVTQYVSLDFDDVNQSETVQMYTVDADRVLEDQSRFQASEVRLRTINLPESTITVTRDITDSNNIADAIRAHHDTAGTSYTHVYSFEIRSPRNIQAWEAFQVRLIANTSSGTFDVTDFATFNAYGQHSIVDESEGIFYDDGWVFSNRYGGAKSTIGVDYEYSGSRIKSYYRPNRIQIEHEAELHYRQSDLMKSDVSKFTAIDAVVNGVVHSDGVENGVFAGDTITFDVFGLRWTSQSDLKYQDYADIYVSPIDGKFPAIVQRHDNGSFTFWLPTEDTQIQFKISYGNKEVIKTITVLAVDPRQQTADIIESGSSDFDSETSSVFTPMTESEQTRNIATGSMNYYLYREARYLSHIQVGMEGTEQMQLPTWRWGALQNQEIAYAGDTITLDIDLITRYGYQATPQYSQFLNTMISATNGWSLTFPDFIQKNDDGSYTIGELQDNTILRFDIDYGRFTSTKIIHLLANPPIQNFVVYVNGEALNDHHPLMDDDGNLRVIEGTDIHTQVFADYGDGSYKDVSHEIDWSNDRQNAPGQLTQTATNTRSKTTELYRFRYTGSWLVLGSSATDISLKKQISFKVTSYDHDSDFGGDYDNGYGTGNGSRNDTILNRDGTLQSGGTIVDGVEVERYTWTLTDTYTPLATDSWEYPFASNSSQSGHHLVDYLVNNKITEPIIFIESPGSLDAGGTINPTVWYLYPGAQPRDISDVIQIDQMELDEFIHLSLAKGFHVNGKEVKVVSQAVRVVGLSVRAYAPGFNPFENVYWGVTSVARMKNSHTDEDILRSSLDLIGFMRDAYDAETTNESFIMNGFNVVHSIHDWGNGLDMKVYENPFSKELIFAFWGTDGGDPIVDRRQDDFEADIELLSGITRQGRMALEETQKVYDAFSGKGYQIISVGHSLGAHIAEYIGQSMNIDSVGVGSPGLADEAWIKVKELNPNNTSRHVRIATNFDPITSGSHNPEHWVERNVRRIFVGGLWHGLDGYIKSITNKID